MKANEIFRFAINELNVSISIAYQQSFVRGDHKFNKSSLNYVPEICFRSLFK